MNILITIGVVCAIIFVTLLIFGCCVVSGRSDDIDNEIHNIQNRYDTEYLKDLERNVVNDIKQKLACIFEYNANENITISDCIIKNDYYDSQVVLCKGKVIGFTL